MRQSGRRGGRRSSGKRQYALYVKPRAERVRGQEHFFRDEETGRYEKHPAEWHGYEKHMQSTDIKAIKREQKRMRPRWHTKVFHRNPSKQTRAGGRNQGPGDRYRKMHIPRG